MAKKDEKASVALTKLQNKKGCSNNSNDLKNKVVIERHRKVTKEQIKEALLKNGGIHTAAAAWIQKKYGIAISRSGISARIAKCEELKEAARAAEEQMKDIAESKLYKAVQDGELKAVFFYLNNKGKDRGYGNRPSVKISQSAGGENNNDMPKVEIYLPDNGRAY